MQGEIDIEILQKWSNDFYPGEIFLSFFQCLLKEVAKFISSRKDIGRGKSSDRLALFILILFVYVSFYKSSYCYCSQ
jgi:hypothetical protein